jgi:hypothetical protein
MFILFICGLVVFAPGRANRLGVLRHLAAQSSI